MVPLVLMLTDVPIVYGGSNSEQVKRRAFGGLARLICALRRSEAHSRTDHDLHDPNRKSILTYVSIVLTN